MALGRCPFCLWPIGADDTPVTCPHCNAHYHEDCFAANGACTTFGCPGWAQRPLGGASLEDNPVASAVQPEGRITIDLEETSEPSPPFTPAADPAFTPAFMPASMPEPAGSAQSSLDSNATGPVTPWGVAAFCDQCGTPVGPDDQFCATCGNPLGAI